MANQILAGAVVQAGMVIAGVDANNPPYVGPVQYMPENTNDGSTTWNTIGSNLPDTRNATELTWNIDNSVAPMTAYGTNGWMFQKVSEASIQLDSSYIVSLKVLNATSDLTVRVVKGNTEYGFTPSMVSVLAEQTIPAGDYTNSPQLVSMVVDIGATLGTWDNTLMIQFASVAGYGTFSIQDVLLTDKPAEPILPASYFMVAGPYSDIDAQNSGRVYIFNSITENYQTPDSFITSVGYGAYFGDRMDQNSTKVAISAYGEENMEGAVYVFDKSELAGLSPATSVTNIPNVVRFHPTDAAPYDFNAGYGLSMSDTHLVMGAFGDDDRGNMSGSAYVYDLSTNQLTKKLLPPGSAANARFGFNVAISDTHVAVASSNGIHVWELSDLNASPTHMDPTSYSTIVEGGFKGGQGQTLHIYDNKLFTSNRSTSSSDNWAGEVYMFDMNDLSAEPTIFEIPLVRVGQATRIENDKLYVSALGVGVYIWDLNDTSADPVLLEKPAAATGDFADRIDVTGSSLLVSDEGYLSAQGSAYSYDLNNLSADPIIVTSGTGQEEYFGKGLLAVE